MCIYGIAHALKEMCSKQWCGTKTENNLDSLLGNTVKIQYVTQKGTTLEGSTEIQNIKFCGELI